MKIILRKILSFALIVGMILSISGSIVAADGIKQYVEKSASYIMSVVSEPKVGSVGGEWAVIGLARSDADVPQEYWDSYYEKVEEYVRDRKGVLHKKKYTEYSRVILALTAIGADPANVAGYDLLSPLGDFEKTIWQGINGPIWALIALDSGSYPMPVNNEAAVQATRQMYVDDIISRQNSDGGWSLTSKGGAQTSDPDITGMALQALSNYKAQSKVASAIDKAINCLSIMQNESGGYESYGTSNSESIVQVIVALCALGIDPDDSRFVKNGVSLCDNLLSYQQADGSFSHTSAGSCSDLMASEQGLYGLAAILRSEQGRNSLYRMSDCNISVSTDGSSVGLEGRHKDVRMSVVTIPGASFPDIVSHSNRAAIEALTERGIINGKSPDSFDPDATMTRAEFAAIIVRGLGLPLGETSAFKDVRSGVWHASYIGAAHKYGIVNGKTPDSFDPDGTITRQEAATMVARAAGLCGMDTEMDEYEILNMLAQFGDYIKVSQWARESTAFCYKEDILDRNDLDIEPLRTILRCEVAQMLYNMMETAKLL